MLDFAQRQQSYPSPCLPGRSCKIKFEVLATPYKTVVGAVCMQCTQNLLCLTLIDHSETTKFPWPTPSANASQRRERVHPSSSLSNQPAAPHTQHFSPPAPLLCQNLPTCPPPATNVPLRGSYPPARSLPVCVRHSLVGDSFCRHCWPACESCPPDSATFSRSSIRPLNSARGSRALSISSGRSLKACNSSNLTKLPAP